MSNANFHVVESPEQFQKLLSDNMDRVSLISFWASWAEPCERMNKVVEALAEKYPDLLVLQVEADKQEEIAETFDIEVVPSILLLRGHEPLGRIDSADAQKLTDLVDKYVKKGPAEQTLKHQESDKLVTRMRGIMNQSPVVLFMKGEPDKPRCGFSRKAVALLREQNVTFTHFDILEDEDVRQGLKELNEWPTYPQFIVKGEFVGGLDVITEMVSNGEFEDVFKSKE